MNLQKNKKKIKKFNIKNKNYKTCNICYAHCTGNKEMNVESIIFSPNIEIKITGNFNNVIT